MTSNCGGVVGVGTDPAAKSTLPYEYPNPSFETVTLSIWESLLTTTFLHSFF